MWQQDGGEAKPSTPESKEFRTQECPVLCSENSGCCPKYHRPNRAIFMRRGWAKAHDNFYGKGTRAEDVTPFPKGRADRPMCVNGRAFLWKETFFGDLVLTGFPLTRRFNSATILDGTLGSECRDGRRPPDCRRMFARARNHRQGGES